MEDSFINLVEIIDNSENEKLKEAFKVFLIDFNDYLDNYDSLLKLFSQFFAPPEIENPNEISFVVKNK